MCQGKAADDFPKGNTKTVYVKARGFGMDFQISGSGKRQFKMFKFSVIPGFGHIVSLLANIFHLACYCPVVQKCALISICERNSFLRVMTKRSLRASSRISKRPISVEEFHRSSRVNTYVHDVLYIIYYHILTYIHIMYI